MHPSNQHKERKFVPRFRRRNANENVVDADDVEAQVLIEKDLQSHFKWTSDLNEEFKYQFDNFDEQYSNQQISLGDQNNEEFLYDIDPNNQQLWNINIEDNDNNHSIKWSENEEQKKMMFSGENLQEKEQQWSLHEMKENFIKFDQNDQSHKYKLDTNNEHQEQIFIQGEQFRHQMKFAIASENEQLNVFPTDSEDFKSISFDSNIPSIQSILSLPQAPIILHWLEGISHYTLSLPVQEQSQEYSPFNSSTIQIDSDTLKSLKWSLELLKENLLRSFLISLPENKVQQLSLPGQFHLNFSTNDEINHQLFSTNDCLFKQTLSLSTDDIKQQLLSIIDSIERKQNFGNGDQLKFYQWSLEELKITILNISPEEVLKILYSPDDAKPIELEQLLIESDEISARAFRRYRCKHMSIKTNETDQLDSEQAEDLKFKGNETIAIGEEQIQNDFDDEQLFKDLTKNEILLKDDLPQSYDTTMSESAPSNLGPCLFRSDYERTPPRTWPRLRREIGYISFDGSLANPIYYLDKSYKRYVHIPEKRDQCSYDVYQGYQEFIQHIRANPENYFRAFDSTDLRHLLYWYSQKQYLFSSINPNLLQPPKFICRRTVLRKILANLYCDSDPWKLLVCRIKGQFYMAIANKATKQLDDMTEDEYSGYHFEQLFTTQQPNTTRIEHDIPLRKPQQQFHTVQYWQFGEHNILYCNEIDGEIAPPPQTKSQNENLTKQEDNSTKPPPPATTENKENVEKMNWWDLETRSKIDNPLSKESEDVEQSGECEGEMINPPEEIENEEKQAQINENLELANNEETEGQSTEKKKDTEHQFPTGYIEMKCTNKKIFYRDENKLQTLHWWAQMWLANVNTLLVGYKTPNDGIINQLDLLSTNQIISKFLSRYNLHLKYCFSYLHSFLQLIEQTVHIDDPNTIHLFTYLPQPLEIDPITGKPLQMDLPKSVPFRYTQMKRTNQRHSTFMPDWYLQGVQRTIPIGGILKDESMKSVEQEMKKRISHRGRTNCILKQQQKQIRTKKKK